MKRIGILTAGGDTPALNATIYGAVQAANQRRVELVGLVRGYDALFHPRIPSVRLNPLFGTIPELDPARGGTILGASRKYFDPNDEEIANWIFEQIKPLALDGLICVGGDGTMNGMQPLCDGLPCVLAPKTIDNDLGLNFPQEPAKWLREEDDSEEGFRYTQDANVEQDAIRLDQIVNYVTPGYATAVFVSAGAVRRVRTTAESHRRIAIVEVMGRHSGYIAMGAAYGQPDLILIPEVPINMDLLVRHVKDIYQRQQNVVIVCGEGVVDEEGCILGDTKTTSDPGGNILLSGAANCLKRRLVDAIGDQFFAEVARKESARRSIFTRKVGHTQRGGRPLNFDRFLGIQQGGKAVEMLLDGLNNHLASVSWNEGDGFVIDSFEGNRLRDKWGHIHARQIHASHYDAQRLHISAAGAEYLLPIFTNAIGPEDMEHQRQSLFDSGNLFRRYHSVNVDIEKRIDYIDG